MHNTGKSQIRNKIWFNVFVFLLSSAALCALSLNFAIGTHEWESYIGYFKHPLIFLLNWLPVLFVQVICCALVNRQWLSFLITSIITLIPAIGNFFKLKFRNEPFTFLDISSVRAGLMIAGNYNISMNTRILVSILCVIAGTVFLLIFARRKIKIKVRISLLVLVGCAVWPLWKYVYSSDELDEKVAYSNYVMITLDSRELYIASGFQYPFIHSITESAEKPPADYTEDKALSLLSDYTAEKIPEDNKVNILILQLESFSDLEAMGIDGISEEVYSNWRTLEKQSCNGLLIPNIIGGGTINTERCLLAGTNKMLEYKKPSYSYVRYFKEEGYYCIGTHPNVPFFYSRQAVMDYLGFDDFYFLGDHFEDIAHGDERCDDRYLPEVFQIFKTLSADNNTVFSFNITMQGHSPYNEESLDRNEIYWNGFEVSDQTFNSLNNYLSLITETQQLLLRELEKLDEESFPAVVLIYGDHKPWFGMDAYKELGISFDLNTEKGMLDYLSTPYIIWANESAKEVLQNDFQGSGETVSPGYLMNVLFEQLNYKGPAFMQYTDSLKVHIPVISAMDCYVEEEQYCRELSQNGKTLYNDYSIVQYYLYNNNYKTE